jgi:hypothetical protein
MNAIKAPKPIHPRSPDTKYNGTEPLWNQQPESEIRQSKLVIAFGWYHYYCSRSDAKSFMLDWLERNGKTKEAKLWRAVPEQEIPLAIAWLARMHTMGLQLNAHEESSLLKTINNLLSNHSNTKTVEVEEKEPQIKQPNIQDRLREKAAEAGGELEGMLDDLIASGVKIANQHNPMSILRGMNISPQHINIIREPWLKKREEFFDAMEGSDAQLVEAYGHFGKIQLRNLVKFVDQVLADCDSYIQIKKVERKPRKKKAVSPEKLTAKFKYLREFPELKLTSEAVTKLVGASEAWLYDTKKRKLIYVVADSHVGNLTVKSSALIGFDATNSVQKTLRKPAEQIKALMSGGVPAARKYFKEIKATETKYNGRGNENVVLLRIR